MNSFFEFFDHRAKGLLAPGTQLEKLADGGIWCEGPVWMPQDGSVLYSDIPNNRMLRWHPSQGASVWREQVLFTNGHALDQQGNLLHCSHGQRAITRTRFGAGGVPSAGDSTDSVMVSHFQGGRLNSPNDLVVKSDGSIWFTDPPYGILSNHEGFQAPSEQEANHVFRFDPSTRELEALSDWVQEPNGIAFSPDELLLYVTDTSAALRPPGQGHHHIVVFDVINQKQLRNPRTFAVIEPGLADGIKVDAGGWLYSSSLDSVQVFHPDGSRLAKIYVPEKVGNLCFGGDDGRELFICATSSLYRVRLNPREPLRGGRRQLNGVGWC